jgi:hypothetical protein
VHWEAITIYVLPTLLSAMRPIFAAASSGDANCHGVVAGPITVDQLNASLGVVRFIDAAIFAQLREWKWEGVGFPMRMLSGLPGQQQE